MVSKPSGKIMKLHVIQTTIVEDVKPVTNGVTNVTETLMMTVSTVLPILIVPKNTKPP